MKLSTPDFKEWAGKKNSAKNIELGHGEVKDYNNLSPEQLLREAIKGMDKLDPLSDKFDPSLLRQLRTEYLNEIKEKNARTLTDFTDIIDKLITKMG